jgi:hypothetical protein
MRLSLCAIVVAALSCVLGCGDLPPAPTSPTAQAPPPPAPAPPGNPNGAATADAPLAETPDAAADATSEPAAETPAEETPADAPADDSAAAPAAGDTTAAEVGVGVKGKDYGGPGFVTTPNEAYFRTGERIAFEIQIPSAMKLYKAGHDNKGPKTHEEFMNVIIKENGVDLPELAEGEEYLYDPQTEQLLVRHPAQ